MNGYLRALPQLDFSLTPALVRAAGEPRFAARTGDALVFGTLTATELSGTFRATYTFTPRLSLQGYAQVFFAGGHYADAQTSLHSVERRGEAPSSIATSSSRSRGSV